MISDFVAASSPWFWLCLSGLFLGAACSRATVLPSRARYPQKARERKWTWFFLYLSFMLLAGLAAVLLSESGTLSQPGFWQFFLITAGISFLAFRFKKSLGIPLLLVAVLFIAVVYLFLNSLAAFSGDVPIAEVRVIALEEDSMRLEVAPVRGDPVILSLPGNAFAPVVEVIVFDDAFVFLGIRTYYRFLGVTSFFISRDGEGLRYRQADEGFSFPEPDGISGVIYEYFDRYSAQVPGVKAVQADIAVKRPRLLSSYLVTLQNTGGILIQEK